MEEYVLKPDGLKQIYKTLLPISLLTVCLPAFLMASFGLSFPVHEMKLFMWGLAGLVLVFGLLREGRKLYKIRRDWLSFRIEFSDTGIRKTQRGQPEVQVTAAELSRVVKASGGVLLQGADPQTSIFVPDSLGRYDELLVGLSRLRPVEESPVTSVSVSPQYALLQHRPRKSFAMQLLKGIGLFFGGILLFFLLVIGLLYFLSS
ncbi:hypothetical protein [Gorillibacterium sp. sgz500922]|uniref:hypothetical protein n=1 Tax=Gorillibacterium sp. sgz500922 TaxID=3446694 RepID=UPI003F679089